MRCCLSVPPFTDPAAVLDLARDAEAHGWDGFFLWDHLSWDGTVEAHDPWTLLGAIAVQTRRIRIGTMVTPLSRRRPAVVAKHLTTLDHLSGGRVTLGVGLGDPPDLDFADLGDEPSYRVRAEITDEALEVVAGLVGDGSVDHRGQHLRATTSFRPLPVQRTRIPIWIAGRAPIAGLWPAPVAGTATSRSPTPSSRPRAWPTTSARTPTTTGTSSPSGPTAPPSTTGRLPARPGWSGRSGRARRAGSTSWPAWPGLPRLDLLLSPAEGSPDPARCPRWGSNPD